MTVAHKDLTGTDLHEVKGASTATTGQVPVSNGAGGAPFALLTHTSLQTTGNPFGAQLLHVREEQAAGVNSSSSAVAGWFAQVLNTAKTNEIAGASLGSNQITLPAGTYYIHATAGSYQLSSSSGSTMAVKARLRNITDGTTTLTGPGNAVIIGGSGLTMQVAVPPALIHGRFTIAAAKTFEFQHYAVASSVGAPRAFNGGETEVYADVMIWKVA